MRTASLPWRADKPFFGGNAPAQIDGAAYAFLANLIVPPYDTPLRQAALRHDNLTAYVQRMGRRLFPEPALAKST